jgi:sugar lactone lactonase YvrE
MTSDISYPLDKVVTSTRKIRINPPMHSIKCFFALFFGLFACASGALGQTLSITTNATLPAAYRGDPLVPISLAVFGGKAPYTFATKNGSSLPPGLSLNATGRFAGTPTQEGNYSFTITAKDSATPANTSERTFSLAVQNYNLIVNGPQSIGAKQYSSISPLSFSVSGGVAPYIWSSSPALPASLTINATTGVISGNLTAAPGVYAVTVSVKDKGNRTASKNCTITIQADPPVWVTPDGLPSGKVAAAYSQSIGVSGGKAPYTFSIKSGSILPPGLTLNATGRLAGTPTKSGNFSFTIVARDSAVPSNTIERTFSQVIDSYGMAVSGPNSITGLQYTIIAPATYTVTGGVAPFRWSATGLPQPLSINATTGVVTGNLTAAPGNYSANITVTDNRSQAATLAVSVPIQPLQIQWQTPTDLPAGKVSFAYSQNLTVSAGKSPYTYILANGSVLPSGLMLNSTTGVIGGRPTSAGNFSFTITARDSALPINTSPRAFKLTIAPMDQLAWTINPSPSGGKVAMPYSASLPAAIGGSGNYTYSVFSLPLGLSFNATTRVISGTPRASGDFNVRMSVKDNFGNATTSATLANSTSTNIPIIIEPYGLSINGTNVITAQQYSTITPTTFTPVGGIGNYTWSANATAGLTINATSGIVRGTLMAAPGNYSMVLSLRDGRNQSVTKNVNVQIGPLSLNWLTAPTLPSGKVGFPYTANFTVSGGRPTYSYVLKNGSVLPPGLTLNTTSGVISGTPNTVNGNNAAVSTFIELSNSINPSGITIDSSGNFYITTSSSSSVWKITPDRELIKLAGSSTTGSTDGVGGNATFNILRGIVIDKSGNLFVAEWGGRKIRKITQDGTVTTFAGSGENGSADGLGANASFSSPWGIATDGFGNFYVADSGNNKIRKITPDGLVTTFAGSGGNASTDGTGINASFSNPRDLAVDKFGNLYVTEVVSSNHKIRKITPNGAVTTFAGSGEAGSSDGIGSSATFSIPSGIAVDDGGNVYVSDSGNDKIRKISSAGDVITLAGNLPNTYIDGNATTASFASPRGLAIDSNGNLFVADQMFLSSNSSPSTVPKIRKISPEGHAFTVLGLDSAAPIKTTTEREFILPIRAYGMTISGNSSASVKQYGYIYLQPFTANHGLPPYKWSSKLFYQGAEVKSPSISINATTGIVSGASSEIPGWYDLQITVTDSRNQSSTKSLSINILQRDPVSWVTPSLLPTAKIFTSYNAALMGFQGRAPYTYTLKNGSTLPAGLSLNQTTGVISGTPTSLNVSQYSPSPIVTTLAGSPGSVDQNGNLAPIRAVGLAVDNSGNIYASNSIGNRVQQISPLGIVKTIAGSGTSGSANGMGSGASFSFSTFSSSGLALDKSGVLYATDYNYNRIRKITPEGLVTTLADYTSSLGQLLYPRALTIDGAGNIYVTTGSYKILKLTSNGVVTVVAGSGVSSHLDGKGTAANFTAPMGITTDPSGNIYVSDAYRIRKITPTGVVTTLAGSGNSGSTDGVGVAASFGLIYSLTSDKNGNIYAADATNNKIRKITPAGAVTTLAGSGVAGSKDGAGSAAQFIMLRSITSDSSGNLYVSEALSSKIRKITPQGLVTSICGSGAGAEDGSGSAASFFNPSGVAVDNLGNSYIADANNHKIRKITADGMVTTLAGSSSGNGSTDGVGSNASFNSPRGVAVDSIGNVYVADTLNHKIRKITPSGAVSTLAGSGGNGSINGVGAEASFNTPYGLAVDVSGNVYVADTLNRKIRKITSAGEVTTLAGSGVFGSSDGNATTATFSSPYGVAVDEAGFVYVADSGSNKIRKITSTGNVTTLAGSGSAGAIDGTGIAASFNFPRGITVDSGGNVYVADSSNHKLRKITPAGVVTTIGGESSYGFSDGVANTSKFYSPWGIAVDSSGSLYVGDASNHLVRKIVGPGLFNTFTIVATDSGNPAMTAEREFALQVEPYGMFLSGPSSLLSVKQYTRITPITFSLYGGAAPYRWTATPALPTSLSINATTGMISGTVNSAPGNYTTTITVKDSKNQTASWNCTIRVLAPDPLGFSSLSKLDSGLAKTTYRTSLEATGGKPGYTWSFASRGNLPSNASLTANGVLSVNAPTYLTANFTVKVIDGLGANTTKTLALYFLDPATSSLVTVKGGTLPAASTLANQTVSAFQIGRNEVTWDEWQTVRSWAVANGYVDLANSGNGSAGNQPARDMNFYEVLKWTNAKSEMEGLDPVYTVNGTVYDSGIQIPQINYSANGYRLPTSAEWEWAARGGISNKGSAYSGGNSVDTVAWYANNSSNGTKAVATKSPNEIGIFDMSGNVWERCWDGYNATEAVTYGGSYNADASRCTVSSMNYVNHDQLLPHLGFRYARNIGPKISINTAIPNAALNQPYEGFTFIAVGSSATKTWSIVEGVLPVGLTLNPFNGTLSGFPTQSGTFTFVIRVDAGGYSDELEIQLQVSSTEAASSVFSDTELNFDP